MFKIDLSIYFSSCQYFKLFDVILKDQSVTKEAYLIDNGITPSSYRRARLQEVNVGDKIIKKLSKIFGYKTMNNSQIKEIETRLNQIHNNMYFKIYDTFDDDIKYIDDMIGEKYLLFPIFQLMRLLLIFNKHVSSIKVIEEEVEAFELVKKFKNFYTDEILELYDFLDCAFSKQIPERILSKNTAYPIVYQVLAAKYSNDYKYVKSNYFAEKALDIYIKDGNYKRALYAKLPIMFNLNQLGNYEECFNMANNQYLMLKSFKWNDYEYNATLKHLIVSSFALKKYDLILEVLKDKQNYNHTELGVLLATKYLKDVNDYEKYMKEKIQLDKMEDSERNKKFFYNLDVYLKTKNKKTLKEVAKYPVYETFISLLKKL